MHRAQVPKGKLCTGCPRIEDPRCVPSPPIPGQSADVLVVAPQPDDTSAVSNWPFNGHGGKIVRTAVRMLNADPRFKDVRCRYAYAAQCYHEGEKSPTKKALDPCHSYLTSTLAVTNPKVIVAMGAVSMRQLGIKAKFKTVRGRLMDPPGVKKPVMVTFSDNALLGNPGLFEAYKLDLSNAFRRAIEGPQEVVSLEELSKNYILPLTVDGTLALCKHIEEYAPKGDADKWSISVDTETTTLHPERKDAKIIAVCFGWGKKLAGVALLDHPNAPEEFRIRRHEVVAAIRRVLASKKPKIFHNAKFDLQFLEMRYDFAVNNVAWDTLLGEHLLDEDKKGNYGLKVLTSAWMPTYCGYEDKLQDMLETMDKLSPAEAIDKELSSQQGDILQKNHPLYFELLGHYRSALDQYGKDAAEYAEALQAYQYAEEDYTFMRAWLQGAQAVWKVEVQGWERKQGKKPKKPVRWFKKPKKPKKPPTPKKPKDPRSKKEKAHTLDAGYERIAVPDLQVYGGIDGDVTRQLAPIQLARIKAEKSTVSRLMRSHAIPASRSLGRMEFEGIRVDRGYAHKLGDGLREVVERTEQEVYQMAGTVRPDGKAMNLNHAGTLANVLYSWGWTHLDGTQMEPYECLGYTAKNQPSTAEKVLRPYITYADSEGKLPTQGSLFAERILQWKKASKARNTFLANTLMLSREDGFLHCKYHLNGTGTGRLSSSDMNMQNLPKYLAGWNIKKLFIPDSDDFAFVNVDYKGAEVRVFTAYAADPALIKALNEGLDMHCFFASEVFHKPYEMYARRNDAEYIPDKATRALLELERNRIKRVVFGILYGAGPFKISESIGITVDEAKALVAMLYKMFPALKTYKEFVEREVLRQGYVETKFGRRRRFPLSMISRHRSRAFRQARNFKIQSTSSDIVISQLMELEEPLRKDFGGRLLLTVHDSIAFQFPKKYLSQLEEFVLFYAETRVREKFPWLPVPFKVDIEVGDNYGECSNLDDYIKAHPFTPQPEGIVEEHEILEELRNAPFN